MPVTDVRWLSGAMSIRPLPTPATAVAIGSAIANSEPNARSKMTAAAPMPTADMADSGACSVSEMAFPPSSTARPGSRAAFATVITRLTSAWFRLSGGLGEVHRGVRGAPVRAYLDASPGTLPPGR